jgi:hypothetical protein
MSIRVLIKVGVIFSGFKVIGFKEHKPVLIDINAKFILICTTGNRKSYINIFVKILVGSKSNNRHSVTVTDLDDEAPTNIQINDADTDINGFVTLANDKGVGFVIGTLSA